MQTQCKYLFTENIIHVNEMNEWRDHRNKKQIPKQHKRKRVYINKSNKYKRNKQNKTKEFQLEKHFNLIATKDTVSIQLWWNECRLLAHKNTN